MSVVEQIEQEQPRAYQAVKPPAAVPGWAQQLVARIAAAETKLAALEKRLPAPAPAPVADDSGTTVTTIIPKVALPSPETLEKMALAVLEQHPSLRRIAPNMTAASHDRFFAEDFAVAYERVMVLVKTDVIDRTMTAIDWCTDTFNWRLNNGRQAANIWGSAFTGAAYAAGVKVDLGATPSATYFGLKK